MRLLWILLCCGGLFAQIFLLVFQYMRYDISTSVTFTFENIIHLPAITICATILELGKWDDERLRKHCGELTGSQTCMNETAEQISSFVADKVPLDMRLPASFKFMDHLTISEIMQVTHEVDKLIMGHLRFNPEIGGQDKVFGVADTYETVHFLTGIYKCATLIWKKRYETAGYLKLKRQFTSSGLFSVIVRNELLMDKISMLTLSYTGNRVIPRIGDSDFIQIPGGRGLTSSSYDLFMSKFLEAPFATDCVDYRRDYKLESRADCYDTCFEDASVRALQRKPLGVRHDGRDGGIMSMSESFVTNNHRVISRISNECDNKCSRQDCVQTVYSPRMKSMSRSDNSSMTGYLSYVPNSPIVVTECMQKITFAEFATDLGSTFGFWLGLSVLTAFTWMQKLVQKIVQQQRACKQVTERKERRRKRMAVTSKHYTSDWMYAPGTDLYHVHSYNKMYGSRKGY